MQISFLVLCLTAHIFFLVVILILFGNDKYYPISFINEVFNILGISKTVFIKWTFIIICMYKPVNTTFKVVFADSKPIKKSWNDKNDCIDEINSTNDTTNVTQNPHMQKDNNGAIIGFLERIIIVILISVNQYSAIGFILTAKSVARYNKISEDAKFGEYYLIGTLYSTLFAIVIYLHSAEKIILTLQQLLIIG